METLTSEIQKTPQGLKLNPLSFTELVSVGMLLKRRPLETYTYLHEAYGDIVYCPWLGRETIFLFHPDHIRHVLKDNHTNYQKSSEYVHLKPLLGLGLLTSEGDLWRQQRNVMAKQFHAQSIDLYMPGIQRRIMDSMETLCQSPLNDSLDMSEFYSALTFEVAGEIFFGASVEKFSQVAGEALDAETQRVSKRMRRLFNLPMSVPSQENRRGKSAINNLNQIVGSILGEDHSKKSPNVLTKLLGHEPKIPKKQIRDEVMTLLLAGHETTSNTLAWTTWYLGLNPEWQEILKSELAMTGKAAKDLTRSDLMGLKNFRNVLNESLRLMPPVPVISRMSMEDDIVDGYLIPKGTNVICQQWVTHRDPRFWPNPLNWTPERFNNREDRKDDFTFFPFARGARSCIGEDLAMIEGTLILAHLIEAFSWQVSPGFRPEPVHNLTLRSRNGMWLKLFKR